MQHLNFDNLNTGVKLVPLQPAQGSRLSEHPRRHHPKQSYVFSVITPLAHTLPRNTLHCIAPTLSRVKDGIAPKKFCCQHREYAMYENVCFGTVMSDDPKASFRVVTKTCPNVNANIPVDVAEYFCEGCTKVLLEG